MSELEFLSPDRAESSSGFDPRPRSPLARALERAGDLGFEDVSLLYGKLEVRGRLDGAPIEGQLASIAPDRALVLCPYERTAEVRAELLERFPLVIDRTGALAGLRLRGSTLMRRLTELDLQSLPAAGAVAGVPAVVFGDAEEFTIVFGQEYGHYFAGVVCDAVRALS